MYDLWFQFAAGMYGLYRFAADEVIPESLWSSSQNTTRKVDIEGTKSVYT
jgi:hypothetical protein